MKKVALFTALTLFIFGFLGNVFSYEGGTKLVATMTHSEEGKMVSGPLSVVSYGELVPGKLIQGYLHQLPKPTLSAETLREEMPGPSLGPKAIIRFQKTGRV